MPSLAAVSVSQVELIKVIRPMNDRMASVVARISLLLHRMEVVVTTMVGVLAVAAPKIAVGALDVAQGAVMRSKANLRSPRVRGATVVITAMHLMATSSNDMGRANSIFIVKRRGCSW